MASQRPTRAYLAVPAHRARVVAKAAASSADAVFMDLEDAVPPAEKGVALTEAARALSSLDWGSKHVAVRLNAVDSPFIAEEIRCLAALPRLDALIVPKAERVSDIVAIADRFRAAAPDRAAPVALELLIETALGLVNVDALAACHDSVAALHLGVGDLAASLGARTSDIGISPDGYRHVGSAQSGYASAPLDLFAYPMMRLLVAARACGLRAIDGPCGAFRDAGLTEASAQKAAAMGFDGKQVIHPDQIEPTLRAFTPSAEELAQARRVVEAMEQAEAQGQGAVTLDGKMIDYANVRMARRIIGLGS
ncbi:MULTISPECIES: CoA ester lyase [Bradyrhizobium]|uniref:HpcH/HpaI aldolase/citrate lyase family protein n=1 Tax=Bradyrhizobium TaxID=374 RepID=UPI0004B054EF|nr:MULTISPECIES: CoA ester lyase [Bradyrhizobium]MCA1476378.1 CoA ester lyase [Bradyrhizobium sp. NBAIM08]